MVIASLASSGQKKVNPKIKPKPGEHITVNKKYDPQGNLIQYDSTYEYEWHGDTLMAFPNGGMSFFAPGQFPDMQGFLKQFFPEDSLHHFSPFDDQGGEDFFNGFGMGIPNEDFFRKFSLNPDSLGVYNRNDSTLNPSMRFGDFNFPGISEFFRNFEQFGNPGQPLFYDKQQQKEWEDLQKKYQKEIEEFNKKWGKKNKDKPDIENMSNIHKI